MNRSMLGFAVVAGTIAAAATAPQAAQGPPAGTVHLAPFVLTLPDGRSIEAEDGLLFVPENRSKSGSRAISIHFIRLRGRPGERRSPIFWLPGGPGGFVRREQLIGARFQPQLHGLLSTGRDVVFVNQRGNPNLPMTPDLRWPAMPQPLDAPGNPERDRTVVRKAVTEGLAAWTARGVDLSGYDIPNIADDVKDLAAALGYRKIILRGGSFGSQWSFSVIRRHPALIDRAVLHGIEPLDYGYDSPTWLWNAIVRIGVLAAADTRLAPKLPADGLVGAVKTVLDRLGAKPVAVPITDPKTGAPVVVTVGRHDLVRQLKYPIVGETLRDNFRKWPRFVLEMLGGDYRYLAALAFTARTAPDGGLMIEFLIDNSMHISAAREKQLLAEPEAQWIGAVEPAYFNTRDLTPTRWADDAFRADFKIQAPVLLIQGDVDVSTPLENAIHMKGFLENGRLLVAEGGGTHDVAAEVLAVAPAVGAAIHRFLTRDLDGMAPGSMFEGIPERVRMPDPQFELPDGPSLYDRWLARNRGAPR